MEKTVETKSCKHCSISFDITNKDLEFYEKVSPVFGGKKYSIPSPTLCPGCRKQRRLSFRNERSLYKRKCDLTGEDIVSIYSPNTSYKVYEHNKWWSDIWNPLDYGKEFDPTTSFSYQFNTLMVEVPHLSLYQLNCENSDYINACSKSNKCYMTFNSDFSEESYYGYTIRNCHKTLDCAYTDKSENSYELLECGVCYNTHYSMKSSKCRNSYFLYNCINCEDCFLCSNLVNKKYHILNQEYSQEEYQEKKEIFLKKSVEDLRKDFNLLISKSHRRYMIGYSNLNSTGDNIFFTENSTHCYDSNNIQDCKYCDYITHAKDCMDYQIFGSNSELINECIAVGDNCSKITFSMYCFSGSSNLLYCYGSGGSKDCFGCVGLKNKQYCILNKQYTKEEYETLVPKIIEKMEQDGEWGEFFPSSLSPFGYNETVANEYFPLTREEVLCHSGLDPESFEGNNFNTQKDPETSSGGQLLHGTIFNWSDYKAPFPKVEKIIPASKLPENITDIPDDILAWAIECEVTKKPFRIIAPELEFYRKHSLSVPKRHPDQRHLDRINLRNPRKLFERKCDKCNIDIETTYAPERKEIVYCESCYNNHVY